MTDPAPIGHNNPPVDAFEAFKAHIEDLISLADGALTGDPITTQEQADDISQLKADIKKAKADAEAARVAEKKPHDDAAKAVQAKWKPLLTRADIAAKTAAEAETPWLVAQQKKRDEIAAAKRAEAEAAQAAALAKFKESAPTNLEARFEAEELAKIAKKATAAANKVDRSATGLRTSWDAQVLDYRALLDWMVENRRDDLEEFLNTFAQRNIEIAKAGNMPGVVAQQIRRAA